MPTNPILSDGGIHHVALRVKNFDASISFYTTVLGFIEKVRWNDPPKRIVLLDTGMYGLFQDVANDGVADGK